MLKYIFTLGPASSDIKTISSLLEVADSFRLNSSHLTEETLNSWLKIIDSVFKKNNKRVPVVVDLQGAKMRIGNYPSKEKIPENVTLQHSSFSEKLSVIPVPHKEFFTSVKVGDIVTLNDLKVKIKITSIEHNKRENYCLEKDQHKGKVLKNVDAQKPVFELDNLKVKAVVLTNGPLSSNKGINIETHPVVFSDLTTKDKNIISSSLKYSFTCFAFSFLNDGNESDKIRPLIKNRKLIAKIEREEAINNIYNIDLRFDEIWLCRGDLGAQAGIYNLGRLQSDFIKKISKLQNSCILAGQVLEHMTHFPSPTRSEVVHLYDSIKNGFKGIVLSDETAIGKNPLAVSDFLKKLPTA